MRVVVYVRSCRGMTRVLLEGIAGGLVTSCNDVQRFIECTLFYVQVIGNIKLIIFVL